MSTVAWIIIVVAIVVVLAVAIVAWAASQRRRSTGLRTQFGPEYDRTVNRLGDRSRAESALEQRRERVEKLHLRELRPEDRNRFANSWRATQAQFVDSPSEAITEAERLVDEVMRARGYPMNDFEQRTADISVDHPNVVANYRRAKEIAQMNERGQASTEDLRQAMVHYRALFEDLLGKQDTVQPEARR